MPHKEFLTIYNSVIVRDSSGNTIGVKSTRNGIDRFNYVDTVNGVDDVYSYVIDETQNSDCELKKFDLTTREYTLIGTLDPQTGYIYE